MRTIAVAALVVLAASNVHAGKVAGTGGGKSGTTQVGGNAQDGTPIGTTDKGTWSFNETNKISYVADVDCVVTDGNRTYFSGVMRVVSRTATNVYGWLPGTTYVWGVIWDNGEPEEDHVELEYITPDPGDDTNYCNQTEQPGADYYDLSHGNLQTP